MCYNLRSLVVSFTYVSYQSSELLIGTVQILVDSQNVSTESSGLLISPSGMAKKTTCHTSSESHACLHAYLYACFVGIGSQPDLEQDVSTLVRKLY